MPNDAIAIAEEDPNHIIIWLDANIGNPSHYQHLKAAFSSIADPQNESPVKLVDKDYDDIIRATRPQVVNFEGVWFLLAAFSDIQPCLDCFEQNKDKRIFFITSGSLGATAVPRILERFQGTFTDPVTGKPYESIYVFCHSVELQMDWILNHVNYVKVFTFDADLLVRLIRDVAEYFQMIATRLVAEHPPKDSSAYHRLSWAHQLYQRYATLEQVSMRREFEEVNQLLGVVEQRLRSTRDDED